MLIDRKERIYYLSPKITVFTDLVTSQIIIALRIDGEPSQKDLQEIERVLNLCGLKPIGEPNLQEGKWQQPLTEMGAI